MKVHVELAGGLHLLFSHIKSLDLEFEEESVRVKAVISTLRLHHLKNSPELFISGEGVRPGILVLVNEVDWELEGLLDAEVKNGYVA